MSFNTPEEYKENKAYLDYLIRYSKYTDFPVSKEDEIRILAKRIEDYEKIQFPIEVSVPEYRYYIFNPNSGVFVGGPYACKTWARVCMADKQPKAGAPEMEPYVVVELKKEDIMLKKIDYKRNTRG